MNVGPFQILIIALVVIVLFGRGRISDMMGDFGKGVKTFRRNLAEHEEPAVAPVEGPVEVAIAEPAAEATPDMTSK